jgi:hypothetical protein
MSDPRSLPRAYSADERAFNEKFSALYAGQKAKAERGEPTSTPWRPPVDPFRAYIDRTVLGRETSEYEPEVEHAPAVHVEPGQYSETDMDQFRETAWASLDPETQAAGLDTTGPGFADASQAFSDAVDQVAADAKAEQVAFRDSLKAKNMRAHPENYGR